MELRNFNWLCNHIITINLSYCFVKFLKFLQSFSLLVLLNTLEKGRPPRKLEYKVYKDKSYM